MDDVCVITGGGSGLGRATARAMGERGYQIVLTGRTPAKLETVVTELRATGVDAEALAGDVADRESMRQLARTAAKRGQVTAVIHAAGMSPHMGDPGVIMATNALGTVNVNDAFYEVMDARGCVIDTSSMSAYLTPKIVMPTHVYPLSRTDRSRFMRGMMRRVHLFPRTVRTGVAYGISKHFVIWFARTDAARFGARGVRVVSVTPGSFDTPMGDLESEESMTYVRNSAIKRLGRPEEIAHLYAAAADERMGYLTGTDILCDGGCVAGGASPFRRRGGTG
ncbi:SDR family oxidoreductase [Brooklawnia cerclae]|uniref:NAD(P)-dependent dehydrogenase (Short-subunit alcohol dehydrogenase family) n=1 Tax=Brooklawnia cerclae TaxID=349934 RepID=A0ABX0SEG8_9ACTN|nr:SDR family oxidoreductase [Brooklawnia cerclae]NIH56779.1 NAD(P)-dependent dehydrogenase (short-subunit alcohol dehydrogenase family) [Brooklawnia cerclae]